MATAFPFGIVRTCRIPSQGQLLVWPEIVPLTLKTSTEGDQKQETIARFRQSRAQGEFFGTRPYRVGESLRQIHWKQSAKYDELIVWESRGRASGAVVLLLETAADIHPGGSSDSLEKTLSLGASLANGFLAGGLRVTLSFAQGRVFSLANRQQLNPALDALARFEPEEGADLETLRGQLPVRTPGARSPWVVTTVAGWKRSRNLAERMRFLLIDERDHDQGEPLGTPTGKVAVVPLVDPGHEKFLQVWQRIAREEERV
jgi:uncharacterized protein (DUF58 family)